jgi:hypothetical protein
MHSKHYKLEVADLCDAVIDQYYWSERMGDISERTLRYLKQCLYKQFLLDYPEASSNVIVIQNTHPEQIGAYWNRFISQNPVFQNHSVITPCPVAGIDVYGVRKRAKPSCEECIRWRGRHIRVHHKYAAFKYKNRKLVRNAKIAFTYRPYQHHKAKWTGLRKKYTRMHRIMHPKYMQFNPNTHACACTN